MPGVAVAQRSDLYIHHSGCGYCQIGFCTATAAIITPTYSERQSNARRVAALGNGGGSL